MIFAKLKAAYSVFTAGQQVANPVAWKKGQITGGMVTGLIAAAVGLARAFGYVLPLTDDQLIQIGGAVVAVWGVFNSGITLASSDKIGLPEIASNSNKPSEPAVPEVSKPDQPKVPIFGTLVPVSRRAANGDVITPVDRNS